MIRTFELRLRSLARMLSGMSAQECDARTPTMQSPCTVRLLSFVISTVRRCRDRMLQCPRNAILNDSKRYESKSAKTLIKDFKAVW